MNATQRQETAINELLAATLVGLNHWNRVSKLTARLADQTFGAITLRIDTIELERSR
jgi:hypothetical protein